MGKLIRFINHGIQDFFIINGEDLGDGCNKSSKNPSERSVVSSPLHGPRLLRRMKNRRTWASAKTTSAQMYQHLSLRLYFFSLIP